MVDVFISYSRTNLDKVGRIARAIEAAGYDVWWDAELPPHLSYGDVITAKIATAKAALVVWSPEAAASEWVRAEADVARNQKKLIQTALGDIMPPLPFNQIQYANLGDWDGQPDHPEWRKVMRSLTDLCGPRDARGDGAAGAGIDIPPPFAPRPAAASPPPAPHTAPAATPATLYQQPARSSSKVPILIGAGVAILGLAGAGWMVAGRGGNEASQTQAEQTLPTEPAVEEDKSASEPVALMGAPPNPGAEPAKPAEQAPAPAAQQQARQAQPADLNRDVALINQSGDTIMYIYWSNTQTDDWGADQLGNSVLPDGQSWAVTVADGSQACNFDMMAVTSGGREIVQPNVNVCSVWEVYFN